MDDADLTQAAIECVRSAFISAGQRCTCTRRLIVHESVAPRFIPAICKAASSLIIGEPGATHPVFMGPLISQSAREQALAQIHALAQAGGKLLVEPRAIDGPSTAESPGWFMTPGVMRVDRFEHVANASTSPGADIEIFAPFLRVSVAASLDEAIAQANATDFGLAASIFTRAPANAERFMREARAGCINWNTGTAGASSKLPFGGLGRSGNHRPAGAFSLDYCAYPVAGMVERGDASTQPPGMRFMPEFLG
jgi:succinylglutamic semialdehyde dehydrogenase